MKLSFLTIPDRLDYLLQGRKLYPWAASIGISKGSMESAVKKGGMLGGDALTAIHRCENVRIDWLLEGRGMPYSINSAPTDDIAREILEELLVEAWTVTVITDHQRIALVLNQTGSFEVKDSKDDQGVQQYRHIHYQIIEVITGIIGNHTMDLVRSLTAETNVNLVITDAEAMTDIGRGKLGTWKLLLAPDAIIQNFEVIDAKHRIFSVCNQQELFPTTKDEAILLDHYRAMTPENRQAVNQITTTMAEHRNDAALKKDSKAS
jgi:hypothetical protein